MTLGGGLGWLTSKHGAACDNLLSVDVVLADGSRARANERENADLFLAIRGAGANFGIVTNFRYRLHPISAITAGIILYPLERGMEVLSQYRDYVTSASPELLTSVCFLCGGDGRPAVGFIVFYSGTEAESETVLRPLRTFSAPIMDAVKECRTAEPNAWPTISFPPGIDTIGNLISFVP